MNTFLEKTYQFNEIGETPIGDSYENLLAAFNLIQEEFKEVSEALEGYEVVSKTDCEDTKNKRKAELVKEILDLQVVSNGLLYRLGLNRQQVEVSMDLVAESNLSKFCDSEEDAEKSVEKLDEEGRYSEIDYKEAGEKFVVFGKTEEGGYKILKGKDVWKAEGFILDLIEKGGTNGSNTN